MPGSPDTSSPPPQPADPARGARLRRDLRAGVKAGLPAPTLVGFLFGLAYGGGVIVRDIRRHDLGRRQVFIMSVFLSMVHAIVEDSLIFLALMPSASWPCSGSSPIASSGRRSSPWR